MNKIILGIIGIGILGGTYYFLSKSGGISDIGGAFGGSGETKKEIVSETATGDPLKEITYVETTTTEPFTQPIIYNITFPENVFPSIPSAPITEPWWVKSVEPPLTTPITTTTTKKEVKSGGKTYTIGIPPSGSLVGLETTGTPQEQIQEYYTAPKYILVGGKPKKVM